MISCESAFQGERMEVTCECGAVGHVLPPDISYRAAEARERLTAWRGGRIGAGRIAIEDERRGPTACPACQHRACVYMLVDVNSHPFAG